jgi:hypothetical protein
VLDKVKVKEVKAVHDNCPDSHEQTPISNRDDSEFMATPFVANTPHPMMSDRIVGGQSVINHGGQSYRNDFTPLTGMHSARSPNPTKSPLYNNHYSPFYQPVAAQ